VYLCTKPSFARGFKHLEEGFLGDLVDSGAIIAFSYAVHLLSTVWHNLVISVAAIIISQPFLGVASFFMSRMYPQAPRRLPETFLFARLGLVVSAPFLLLANILTHYYSVSNRALLAMYVGCGFFVHVVCGL